MAQIADTATGRNCLMRPEGDVHVASVDADCRQDSWPDAGLNHSGMSRFTWLRAA
jgi:hypothetical protein